MSTEENKTVVRRYIEAIDNNDSSDWSVLDEFVAEDAVVHNPQLPGCTPDRDGIKQAAEMFRQATPGRHEVRLQVAEGDLVVSLIVAIGVEGGEDMEAKGNVVDHEYKIEREGDQVAEISKRWFRIRDTYGIEIAPGQDEPLILAATVCIDQMTRG